MFLKSKISLLILAFLVSSCSQSNVVLDRKTYSYFEDQVKAMVANYIRLKNALVNNNAVLAAREARAFRAYLDIVQLNKLAPQAQKYWIDKEKHLRDLLVSIGVTHSLDVQRRKFSEISSLLIDMVKEFGPQELLLYKQYCPEALDGEGAAWINEIKEIQNPYSGGLHCGTVKEVL